MLFDSYCTLKYPTLGSVRVKKPFVIFFTDLYLISVVLSGNKTDLDGDNVNCHFSSGIRTHFGHANTYHDLDLKPSMDTDQN